MKILTCLYSASTAHESLLLRSFHEGARASLGHMLGQPTDKQLVKEHGIDLRLHYGVDVPSCDVAIQFGSPKPRDVQHHVCRQNIQRAARQIVYIETPLLGRSIRPNGEHQWYRVGLNGFLGGQDAFDQQLDTGHCRTVLDSVGLHHWPGWQDPGQKPILLLTQLPGDASVRGIDMAEWTCLAIQRIRQHTDREIQVRLHPALSAKGRQELLRDMAPLLLENHHNVVWASGQEQTLDQHLDQCGVCVSFSSGGGIDAVAKGIPTIAQDEASLVYPLCSHFLEEINSPHLAARQDVEHLLQVLANNQFNEQQMRQGLVWQRLWPRIQARCQQ